MSDTVIEIDTQSRLLIGAYGYAHRHWGVRFYPQDLPPEWRFIFYSHRHPGLLLPMRSWAFDRACLRLYQEEAPPDFRLVLSVPEGGLQRLLSTGPLPRPLVAGCVVRVRKLTRAQVTLLASLVRTVPVAVDLRTDDPDGVAALSQVGIGVCGRPEQGRPPTGPFAVSLISQGSRPLLGRALRELLDTKAPSGRAVFFYDPRSAIRWAAEAQLLVGMMGGAEVALRKAD